MNKLLSVIALLLLSCLLIAQNKTVESKILPDPYDPIPVNSIWKQNGSEIYYTGNVGIGVTNPSQKLQVEGNLRLLNSGGNIYKAKGIYFTWASAYGTQFNHGIFSTNGTSYTDAITLNSYGNVRINFDSNSNGTNTFTIGHQTTGLANTLFTVNESGNVGIGTGSPSYKLQAQGDIYANGGWLRVSGARGLYFQSYGGGFYMADATWIRTYNNKSFYHNTGIMRTDGTFQVGPSGNRFIVNTSGNVGIGATSPSQKLHVNGDTYLQGKVYIGNTDTYFYRDAANRIKTNDMFYVGTSSPATYLYSTNTYLGASSGDKIHLRGNIFSWTSGGGGIINSSGNVGIGKTNPTKKLDVNGDINFTGDLYKNGQLVSTSGSGGSSVWTQSGSKIYYDGGKTGVVGIGMTPNDTDSKLQLKSGWGDWIQFHHTSNSGYWAFHNGSEQETFHIYYRKPDGTIIYPLRLKADGSIQTMELLVAEVKADNIKSKKLTLEIENVADYVFEEDYKLNSLDEVESFVRKNKHLPGIPSAKVLEEQGVNVAEMSNLLLEKVEELTLYIIQLENRISELENK